MDDWLMQGIRGGLIGGVVGGILGGLAVAIWALLRPAPRCEECGEPLPKVRKARNARQMLWGGWTCPHCGAELDRHGKLID